MRASESKIVESNVEYLGALFQNKFDVDFYQREYVWGRKQIEDLIIDLSTEFLKNWKSGDTTSKVKEYDPYYMGEIVLSVAGNSNDIIDGQQRITSLTLLLIYLLQTYGDKVNLPKDLDTLVYGDDFGEQKFNLDIPERRACMSALLNDGEYQLHDEDTVSVHNLVARYADIGDCWNEDINEGNVVHFAYWVKEKIAFSKVWTNSDEFAYVIFETMNDRGLSLTQVEMLRSYLLANIDDDEREFAKDKFDKIIARLATINPQSKSKMEFDFFKVFFRGHFAEDLSQSPTSNSDFIRIGKEFHRWVRDNEILLGLDTSKDYINFIDVVDYYSQVYKHIYELIALKNTSDYLYLIVNSDYGFTLQPALILAAVNMNDSKDIVDMKIKVVSKYLTKVLTWRVWNHWMISQSSMEAPIYDLCKAERGKSVEQLEELFMTEPLKVPALENAPTLNQQNKNKLKVLLALITSIVGRESEDPQYLLADGKDIEVEHIWSNHYESHLDELDDENEFANTRNNIGDLLLLPKSFNASYGDDDYSVKVEQYFSQNILAQTLCKKKYTNAPGFIRFLDYSKLPFKSYEEFTRASIIERAELYRKILAWNWNEQD